MDVAIVYVVLSFIAVMLLCRIYINLYQYKRQDERRTNRMIGEWIRFGLAALCVLAGCFALLTAIVGLFRFDFS